MDSNKHNGRIPQLRFPGFEVEWEEKTLADICNITAGGDAPKQNFSKVKTGIYNVPVISNGIGENAIYGYTDIPKITQSAVTVAARGTIGYAEYRDYPYYPIIRLLSVIAKDSTIDTKYLSYLLSVQKYHSTDGGIPQLTVPMIGSTIIPIPSLLEQRTIAECLEAIDQMISAQNQKVESLKAHKKGLMQQLFPQPGATTPPLRFPGFAGEWQEKSFDVICHTITPPLKLQSSQYSSSGKFPIVDQSQTLICGWTNDSSGLLRNTPYIIFGDHTCVLKYIDFPFIQGADGVKILGSNKKDNSKFIYQLLLSNPVKQDGYKRHFSDLKEKIFLLPPTLEEQTKIAECLSSIDEIISVEESKVAFLKAHKKGLMQQLFPLPVK